MPGVRLTQSTTHMHNAHVVVCAAWHRHTQSSHKTIIKQRSLIFAAQTQWLCQIVLDVHGNLLFCQECITAFAGVHTEHLHRQCTIKQQMNQWPIMIMTKKEVTEKRLENVLCPDDGGGKKSSQAARRGKTTKKARKGKKLEREELQRWPTKKSKRDT